MRDYNWNPYKDNWRFSDQYHDSNWNYDPRDQNYYLGRINQSGNNDMSREYFTDNHTDRYYRRSELENKKRRQGFNACLLPLKIFYRYSPPGYPLFCFKFGFESIAS